jgi:hypothetical protein
MIDFSNVYKLIDNALSLDDSKVWVLAIDSEVKEHIIQMNTEDQLEEDGFYSDGIKTDDYSPFTVSLKINKGQRYDHMTFKDTGKFYDSWTIDVDKNGLEIDADGNVEAGKNLFDMYSENILGLTEENKGYLVEILTQKYIEIINQVIFK